MRRHVVLAQILLTAAFLFLLLPQGGQAAPEPPPEGWTGIYNRTDLESIPLKPDGQYILMNDVDLTGKEWPGLCSEDLPFSGILDGNGFSVYGMTAVNANSTACGLFNYICGGTVKNLSISGSSVGTFAGLLCGKISEGTVSDCVVRGTVNASQWGGGVVGQISGSNVTVERCAAVCTLSGSGTPTDEVFLGGIVGGVYGTNINLLSCESSGALSFSGASASVGGVVGAFDASGAILDCGSEMALSLVVSDTGYVGGIVGRAGQSSFSVARCAFRADWSVGSCAGDLRLGGIVGLLSAYDACSVTDCVSFGSLSSSADSSSVGGIVGEQIAATANASIQRCSSFVNISGSGCPLYLGGICAVNQGESGKALVENCHADGSVSFGGSVAWDTSLFFGGICGINGGMGNSVLSLCFSSCDVSSPTPMAEGAVVGMSLPYGEGAMATVDRCYYRAGVKEGFALPVSGVDLSDPAAFSGFDFQQVWQMDSSLGIPLLRSADPDLPLSLGGDTDGNGRLTEYDARLLLQYLTSRVALTDGQKQRADINCDGILDSADVALILRQRS